MERKTEIVERHMTLMVNSQAETLKKMKDALPDKIDKVNFGFKLFERLNLDFGLNKKTLLDMNGDQRLQLAEIWSRNADSLLKALNQDPGYKSLMGNFDELIKFWKNEIKLIDKEIAEIKLTSGNDKTAKKRLKELGKRRYSAVKKK